MVKKHEIEWHWVKGHGSDLLNQRADALARKAREQISWVDELPEDTARVFVKGTCRGNSGAGTWAVVIEMDEETEQASGAVDETTNNRMELMAAIEGISRIPTGTSAQIVTESDYLYQGATLWINGWRQRGWKKKDGKPVSNLDLWQELDKLQQQRVISWQSAKGVKDAAPRGLREVRQLAQEAKALT